MTGKLRIKISPSPEELRKQYNDVFTKECLGFLAELSTQFEDKVQQLHLNRLYRKHYYKNCNVMPKFRNSECKNIEWKIAEIPKRLRNRRIDLGDVSPSNTDQFLNSLNQDVQGVQVDFDDGHCPSWHNQILGHYNVYSVVHGSSRNLNSMPIMMLRPRAWNMIEHNITINGKELPGALVDFGLLMYLNAKMLYKQDSGPYFYLSKLECASEARLWNEIFAWTQEKLGLPYGMIKCCVLIENILATYELEEILYELKDHCIGLNCGIWDYIASIIAKFGDRAEFVLADRQKLSMRDPFLKIYMGLVIQTCRRRGGLATGGMVAKVASSDLDSINQILEMKQFEISSGIDGFLIYDINLIPYGKTLWEQNKNITPNDVKIVEDSKTEIDLLTLPDGTITWNSLVQNIQVAVLFVYYWLHGIGHFVRNDSVEDSATAETSRSQIWQWIRHKVSIRKNNKTMILTPQLVEMEVKEFTIKNKTNLNAHQLEISSNIAMELFLAPTYPEFITTYLNNHPMLHMKYEPIKTKL